MDDQQVMELIEALVAEEHRLLNKGGEQNGLAPEEHRRLQDVQHLLDRSWDLLRQRRAYEEFGMNPDEASLRGEGTVEGYTQ